MPATEIMSGAGPDPVTALLKRRRALFFALGVIAVLALIVLLFVLEVGHWLVVEDPLAKADAIAVLSGRIPVRALEAAALYRKGFAPQIWLTYSAEPSATLKQLGVPFVGEETYNEEVLEHEGVPKSAIHVLEPPIVNTADEISDISSALSSQHAGTVIIVTSKVHTRRVRILWNRLVGGREHAIVRPASDDAFEPGHWLRTSSDALDVVRECLGILNAWAGLPLHPR